MGVSETRRRRVLLVSLLVLGGAVALGLLPRGPARLTPWVLAPPLTALGLALATRRPAVALLLATLVGASLHAGSPLGVVSGVWTYVLSSFLDRSRTCAMGFALCLLGMLQVMTKSGGTGAAVAAAARLVRSRRGSKLGTATAGLLVFFDDYANALMVGPALQPLTDRYRVSRQKLAYLVDSTAAPVAGLSVLSTWVVYEVGLFEQVSEELSLRSGGYALLLAALPYRFYCSFALGLVFMSSAWERDLPPMLAAERSALRAEESGSAPQEGFAEDGSPSSTSGSVAAPGRAGDWKNAGVPLAVLLASVPLGLMLDGGLLERLGAAPSLWTPSPYAESLMASQNNTVVLFCAGLVAVGVAFGVPWFRGSSRAVELAGAFVSGSRTALAPLAILLSAWGLASVCKDLGTGAYLVWLLEGGLASALVPLASFALAALVAFSTGTSWGTMAILVPTVAPLANATGNEALLVITLASVLDGAIFGDHCSPISDTTVMTCVATGCDLLEHVKTQLPYAIVAMGVAATCGYLWTASGGMLWVSYASGLAALTVTLRIFGRPLTSAKP